jgi:hypothetical protein
MGVGVAVGVAVGVEVAVGDGVKIGVAVCGKNGREDMGKLQARRMGINKPRRMIFLFLAERNPSCF